jgi:hypothetical protein
MIPARVRRSHRLTYDLAATTEELTAVTGNHGMAECHKCGLIYLDGERHDCRDTRNARPPSATTPLVASIVGLVVTFWMLVFLAPRYFEWLGAVIVGSLLAGILAGFGIYRRWR